MISWFSRCFNLPFKHHECCQSVVLQSSWAFVSSFRFSPYLAIRIFRGEYQLVYPFFVAYSFSCKHANTCRMVKSWFEAPEDFINTVLGDLEEIIHNKDVQFLWLMFWQAPTEDMAKSRNHGKQHKQKRQNLFPFYSPAQMHFHCPYGIALLWSWIREFSPNVSTV